MILQVERSVAQESRVVEKHPETRVAAPTEERAGVQGSVAVVRNESLAEMEERLKSLQDTTAMGPALPEQG